MIPLTSCIDRHGRQKLDIPDFHVYAAATMFVGMTFPFFDGLLGFFGGFGFAPTTYYVCTVLYHIKLISFHSTFLIVNWNTRGDRST